jgi:hypothetical protein
MNLLAAIVTATDLVCAFGLGVAYEWGRKRKVIAKSVEPIRCPKCGWKGGGK